MKKNLLKCLFVLQLLIATLLPTFVSFAEMLDISMAEPPPSNQTAETENTPNDPNDTSVTTTETDGTTAATPTFPSTQETQQINATETNIPLKKDLDQISNDPPIPEAFAKNEHLELDEPPVEPIIKSQRITVPFEKTTDTITLPLNDFEINGFDLETLDLRKFATVPNPNIQVSDTLVTAVLNGSTISLKIQEVQTPAINMLLAFGNLSPQNIPTTFQLFDKKDNTLTVTIIPTIKETNVIHFCKNQIINNTLEVSIEDFALTSELMDTWPTISLQGATYLKDILFSEYSDLDEIFNLSNYLFGSSITTDNYDNAILTQSPTGQLQIKLKDNLDLTKPIELLIIDDQGFFMRIINLVFEDTPTRSPFELINLGRIDLTSNQARILFPANLSEFNRSQITFNFSDNSPLKKEDLTLTIDNENNLYFSLSETGKQKMKNLKEIPFSFNLTDGDHSYPVNALLFIKPVAPPTNEVPKPDKPIKSPPTNNLNPPISFNSNTTNNKTSFISTNYPSTKISTSNTNQTLPKTNEKTSIEWFLSGLLLLSTGLIIYCYYKKTELQE